MLSGKTDGISEMTVYPVHHYQKLGLRWYDGLSGFDSIFVSVEYLAPLCSNHKRYFFFLSFLVFF